MGLTRRFLHLSCTLILLTALAPSLVTAEEDFYAGKTIHLIVGYSPGGGTDTLARVVAKYLDDEIPGNPAVIVENKPGAGGALAMNHVLTSAPRDGTVLNLGFPFFMLDQRLGKSKLAGDVRDLTWLVGATENNFSCFVSASTGIRSIEDAMNSKTPIKMGATRKGNVFSDIPLLMNRYLGTQFKIVTGYKGSSRIVLAVRQGEIDGACGTISSLYRKTKDLVDSDGDDRLIPLVLSDSANLDNIPELFSSVPRLSSLLDSQEALELLEFWGAIRRSYHNFITHKDVPEERKNILEESLIAVLDNPEFLAEARQQGTIIKISDRKTVAGNVNQILGASDEMVDRVLNVFELE